MKKTVTLAIAAAVQAANGNMTRASQLLMAAGAQPDLRNVVSNLQTLPARVGGTRATASTTGRRRVQAGAWPFRVSASTDTDLTTPDNYGTDLREDVDLNGTMREVQRGGLEDDLELMGLGDDINDDFAVAGIEDGDDDFAEDGFDEFAAADDDEDEGDDEEEDYADKGDDKKEESRRLTAALLNLKELAAKKKAKKKPARK